MRLATAILAMQLVVYPRAFSENVVPSDGSTFDLKFTEGKIEPGQLPQSSSQGLDRSQKSKAAAAAARAGSALQQVQCMKMMDQAQQEQDKTAQMVMMAMASQQCQQADQSAQSAEQNDQSSQQQGQESGQTFAKFTPGQLLTVPSTDTDTSVPGLSGIAGLVNAPDHSATRTYELATPSMYRPEAKASVTTNQATPEAELTDSTDRKITNVELPKTSLNPIEITRAGFDDSQSKMQSNNTGSSTNSAIAISPTTLTKSSASDSSKTKEQPITSIEKTGPAQRKEDPNTKFATYGAASGSYDSSGQSLPADDPFDAMLAQLMGTDPAQTVTSPAGEIVMLSTGQRNLQSAKLPNIFEFASFMYIQLTDNKRVMPH